MADLGGRPPWGKIPTRRHGGDLLDAGRRLGAARASVRRRSGEPAPWQTRASRAGSDAAGGPIVLSGWPVVGLQCVRVGHERDLCPFVFRPGRPMADFERRRRIRSVGATRSGTLLQRARRHNGRPLYRFGRAVCSRQSPPVDQTTSHLSLSLRLGRGAGRETDYFDARTRRQPRQRVGAPIDIRIPLPRRGQTEARTSGIGRGPSASSRSHRTASSPAPCPADAASCRNLCAAFVSFGTLVGWPSCGDVACACDSERDGIC